MRLIKKLPEYENIRREFPLTDKQTDERLRYIKTIKNIFDGKDKRKILIIGPCSADREDAVLDYMMRLKKVAGKLSDSLLLIPRIYTSKPRTNGTGYKGLVHRPNYSSLEDDIYDGIVATRKLHLKIINETGFFGADEMLYPEIHGYISDLLAYTAVGARSVENQHHRLVASGLDMPVGMKNPTSGDLDVMLNAIFAAQHSQHFIYNGYECESIGNCYAHAILRGYIDISGIQHPNYHFEDICDLYDKFVKKNFKFINLIVDCNHVNSKKHYDEQIRISKEVFNMCKTNDIINKFVKGVMIESYIEDGAQTIDEGIYGKSITDPCLGWDKTEKLLYDLKEICSGILKMQR